MENTTNPKPKRKEEKKKSPILSIILLLLLIGAGAVAGYFFNEKTALETQLADCNTIANKVSNEKARVMEELEGMLIKYDTLSANNDQLSDELIEQKTRIEQMLKEARAQNWTISKLKKETATLRSIMRNYVVTIDSLNTLAQNLRLENGEITKELGSSLDKNKQLSAEKQALAKTVKIGQRLEALDVLVIAQRVKSNNVHRETTRASKTNKIKVCFTISRNEIAKAGKRNVYIRIIAPDATIMPDEDGDGKFKFNGTSGYYSLKREIDYDKEEADFCFYYDVQTDYPPIGSYQVEIYEGENQIGSTTLVLK